VEAEAKYPKRPLLLSIALVLSLLFGLGASQEALQDIAFFRGDAAQNTMVELTNQQRAVIDLALAHLLDVASTHRSLGLSLSAAIMVISTAMMLFAVRGFSPSTRGANILTQLVAVQSALLIAHYVALPEYRWAKRDLAIAVANAQVLGHANSESDRAQGAQTLQITAKVLPPLQAGYLLVRSAMCMLIVLTLRRDKIKQYYLNAS
jgi:hypothetical protein